MGLDRAGEVSVQRAPGLPNIEAAPIGVSLPAKTQRR